MTFEHRPDDPGADAPWWASGGADGIDDQDPMDAHRRGRRGDEPPADEPRGQRPEGRLGGEALDLIGRLASEAGRRVAARSVANAAGEPRDAFTREPPTDDGAAAGRPGHDAGPHSDGEVCDACPVCIGLRVVRQARPEVVAHLADAAHHLSLALRALADAHAPQHDGLEKIDLDQ